MMKMIEEPVESIRAKTALTPKIGLILGSGLGAFADRIDDATRIPYSEIANFPTPTVKGHAGQLVLGRLESIPMAIMQGRFHFYEGHAMNTVTLPARVLGRLGIETIVITNAAGGVNTSFQPGDLMAIHDHINLMGTNPLIGDNLDELGTRFPDMTHAYSPDCCRIFSEEAKNLGFTMRKGVYAAFTGPSYETPAEIKMLRTIGADAVGMSTVPEAIVSNHMGLRVGGISCITNMAAGITGEKLSHEEVKETADLAMERFVGLLSASIPRLATL